MLSAPTKIVGCSGGSGEPPAGRRTDAYCGGQCEQAGAEADRADRPDEDRSSGVTELPADLTGAHGLAEAACGGGGGQTGEPEGRRDSDPGADQDGGRRDTACVGGNHGGDEPGGGNRQGDRPRIGRQGGAVMGPPGPRLDQRGGGGQE